MKKKIFLFLIVLGLFSLVLINSLTFINTSSKIDEESLLIHQPPAMKKQLVYGASSNPTTIDPVDCWDIPSDNVIFQVCEGLVTYNLSDPDYGTIPMLAETWHWHNSTTISFRLRQGVTFHDGTAFNASSVIWNLERITWFCNYTGILQNNATSWLAAPSPVYFFPDGVTPIISNFYINSQYNITIELTAPFTPFLDLLTFISSVMVSPYSTPRWNYIDLSSGDFVGTGPFVYDHFISNLEVRFHSYTDYWQGETNIEDLIFVIETDATIRTIRLLAHDFDFIDSIDSAYHASIIADPDLVLSGPFDKLNYFYNEFYCGDETHPGLNVTWRKVLQYAINYTYIIDEIYEGNVVRAPPAVPSMMPGHNSSVQIIDTDITKARLLIMSMFPAETSGLDAIYPGTTEAGWNTLTLRTIQINRHSGHTKNEQMNQKMDETFALIGVETNETIRTWDQYHDAGENHPWDMEISWIGWGADYLDAYNMLGSLFSNGSKTNYAHVNDPYLQSLFEQVLIEENATKREETYMHIQSYLFEISTPDHKWKYTHAPLFATYGYYAHDIDVKGYQYDPRGVVYFYPCDLPYPPQYFILTSDADTPDIDGAFNLDWSDSWYADNYSIYTYDKYITEINYSLTLLADQTAISPYPINGLTNGTYYYIVVSFNEFGNASSNCISIDVKLYPPGSFVLTSDADTPDRDGNCNLTWTASSYAVNYSVYSFNHIITEINGSLNNLAYQTATSPYPVIGLTEGDHYFIVVAHNDQGDTLSNCLKVTVEFEKQPEIIPGYSIILICGLTVIISLIIIYSRHKKIK